MKLTFLAFCVSFLLFLTAKGQVDDSEDLKKQLTSQTADCIRYKMLYSIALANFFTFPDTATKYSLQAIQIAQKLNDKRKEAACAGALCVSLTVSGNYPSALDYGFRSLAIFEKLKDSSGLVFTDLQLMNCYKEQEDYDEAVGYGANAKRLFVSSSVTPEAKGLILSIMSLLFEKTGALDSALTYGRTALKLYPGWAGSYLALGDVHRTKRRFDSALMYYRTGIAQTTKFYQNYVYQIDLYNNISAVFYSLGKIDSSIFYARQAKSSLGINFYPEGKLRTTMQLAELFEAIGKTDSALKYSKLSHELKDSLYSRRKTREAQNFVFKEKLQKQKELADAQEEKNKRRLQILAGILVVFIIIGTLLVRNIRLKQKAKIKLESAYNTLKSTQAQLIQAEKMASLGELTAGIAHEIQNPLNFVNNFSDVNTELIEELRSEIKVGNKEEALAITNILRANEQKINSHGKRAESIVKSMLQHSRQSTGQKEATNINQLTEEYLRLSYQATRSKDKSFTAIIDTHFDRGIVKINVVPQDIGRVLLNLFSNAFYAMSKKRAKQNDSYQPVLKVHTKMNDNGVGIYIKDNGTGMPPKVAEKIFQPFFTTKPTGEGTGLGLSLSYDIIKAHGGEIKVETKEGEGSGFVIQLPVSNNT